MRAQFRLIIKYVACLRRSTRLRRVARIKYANGPSLSFKENLIWQPSKKFVQVINDFSGHAAITLLYNNAG